MKLSILIKNTCKYTFESTASICKLICTRATYIIINSSFIKSF